MDSQGLHRRRRLGCAVFVLAFAASASAQTPAQSLAAFDAELARIRALLRVPGMSVAVVERDSIVWSSGFGLANVATRAPVTRATLFPVASLTKTMTSIAVMQLASERRLALSDDMSVYSADRSILPSARVEHVLSHTSEGEPGAEYLYSGARFNALIGVVERAATAPFEQVLRQRVFVPAAMAGTLSFLDGKTDPSAALARPYNFDPVRPDGVADGEAAGTAVRAAAGVVATAEDLARYLIALDRRRLLDSVQTEIMLSTRRSSGGATLPYALGWFVQRYQGERIAWHYGQETSYAALMLWLPDRHVGAIILANSAAMSDAGRLLEGNVSRSLVALAYLRHVRGIDIPVADSRVAESLARVYVGDRAAADSIARVAFREQRPSPIRAICLCSISSCGWAIQSSTGPRDASPTQSCVSTRHCRRRCSTRRSLINAQTIPTGPSPPSRESRDRRISRAIGRSCWDSPILPPGMREPIRHAPESWRSAWWT